ncbi:hypothetical protein OSB04_un001636 [Centaurea solstitialis]|uniref:Transposase-associated domain-containing protein n=1 Tax=Centaurea solstitialis TaxID=347529 RepID=A0AA38W1J6_9ASTR|nr:hypothetical protein OSB04_un001636 [Centaurea solstitialis]
MTIDKSWTTLRHRSCPEFFVGLDAFLERCKDHLNSFGRCRCPCESCDNHIFGSLSTLRAHIHRHGFSSGYTTWTYHGEPLVPPSAHADVGQTTDELHDYLNDVRQENTANEHNTEAEDEPTEGPSNTNDELGELFKLAATELYPGCDWMSLLDFLAKLSHIKVMNKWTDTSFDQLVGLLRAAYPTSIIPSSHYEARKAMRTVGLGYVPIHACVNDCCLFWDEYKDLQSCPICFESRWKDKNTKGKKVPNKVLRYFPLTPRLKRIYSSRHTAKHMTWHATGQCKEIGKMRHPVDGTSWKHFDATYPYFAAEPRNVRLGLAADGFNPFGNMSTSYSMWPVILTTYNIPPWLCMKESSFMLTVTPR